MRHRKLVGLSVLAIIFAGAQPAYAAGSLVDGSITAGSTICSWTNAQASATPPSTLTIDRASVNPPAGNLQCSDGSTVTLNNSPYVTFDDASGTATADAVDVTVASLLTCRYKVSNPVFNRQGTTRDYVGGPYTGTRVSGFLCPSTATIDQATLSFH